MSFVGRIIAGARDLSFGGPLGNLLAGAARLIPSWLPPYGHGDDARGDPRRRIAFTIAVIALGAQMAKADGAVTRDEVAAFGEVFQVPPGEEEHVRLVFDLARKSTAGFESRPWLATFSSSSSGMLLQRKNDRRDAISRSLIRYTAPAATFAGSRSIRNMNCGLARMRSSPIWMPRSKPPCRRPTS